MGFWAPVGYVAGLFIVYATGFSSLVQLLVITFAGLAVYGSYTAVRAGWIHRNAGWGLSAAFLVAWVVVNAHGGWFMNTSETQRPGSWDFPWYFAAMATTLALYLAALRVASTAEGRTHLDAGAWLITTLLAVLALSYYGEFGPLATAPLPEPFDLLAVVVVAGASYWWAVRSGFHTAQLQDALDGPAEEPETPSGQEITGAPAAEPTASSGT
ncbi:hypothetical protein A8924_5056 [Saccharopolyspora erythraea NRRL 2338]|uniref:Amino acid permease-associated region n=1 Tax=Saccharopolyspora erythraea (strain ATCC 11635 / DSM 40517 / JCM 4748 / NBRC 13426 / NCIMB 8594 / NRRL 2338) TaxID=405948 RepID=A4FIR3_SACEN|nr:hypothetical protein [Saccharopolyspora erythraea]PFG97614.1 hypothetical protein A8924_5056 [Saccharopolyspora erythraea NRRL 2338]QRK87773.1 amino acid permease [Saccharopolyspora erythraea]CAM03938.1 amino acid permease-associated region [Saccharopolyspora erythraea NRRL 2338]